MVLSPILSSRFRIWALGIFLASLVPPTLLFHIMPIGSSTEAREAHVASIILRTGEWILPLRNGIIPSKPPLYHWLAAGLAQVSGTMNPFVCRLPSMLAGAGIVLLAYLLAARMAALRRERPESFSISAGLLAAGILWTTWGFVPLLGEARVDMVFSFFVALAVYAVVSLTLVKADARIIPAGAEAKYWAAFFAACGFAVLARGPIGLILPGLLALCVLAAVHGVSGGIALMCRPRLAWGLVIVIGLPWYILAVRQGGEDFFGRQIIFENLQRFTGGDYVNTQPWWFYLPSFLRSSFPWSLLLLLCGAQVLRRDRPAQDVYRRPSGLVDRLELGLLLGMVAGVLFFSLSSGKRHSYLLPLWPGMSMFLALRLCDWFSGLSEAAQEKIFRCGRRAAGALYCLLLFLALVSIAVLLLPAAPGPLLSELRGWYAPHAFFPACAALGAAAVLKLAAVVPPPRQRSLLLPGLLFACFSLFVLSFSAGMGLKNYLKGFERIAAEINSEIGGKKLAVIRAPRDETFDVVLYYLGRPAEIMQPAEAASACHGFMLSSPEWFDDFISRRRDPARGVRLARSLQKTSSRMKPGSGADMLLFECY